VRSRRITRIFAGQWNLFSGSLLASCLGII
jgi:hypothetical protein